MYRLLERIPDSLKRRVDVVAAADGVVRVKHQRRFFVLVRKRGHYLASRVGLCEDCVF